MANRIETVVARGGYRIALGALLLLHGAIHAIGPLATWGLVEFEDIDGVPTVAMSDTLADGLGAAWLVALVLFVAAGVAVLRHRRWWVPVALAGIVISQALIVLWWDGAWRGTMANALILAAIVVTTRTRGTRPAPPR